MGKTERKDGYYWVQIDMGEWTIGEWDNDMDQWYYLDFYFDVGKRKPLVVGPRIPEYKPKRKGKA